MDYPKLVKDMRRCASYEHCCDRNCEYASFASCEDILLSKGADAIEELLKAINERPDRQGKPVLG